MDSHWNVDDAWGTIDGRKRLPCPEDPRKLLGAPIGQYHCPVCGMMCVAGVAHPSPDEPVGPEDPEATIAYEIVYNKPWPPGYITHKLTLTGPLKLSIHFEGLRDGDGDYVRAVVDDESHGGARFVGKPMRSCEAALRVALAEMVSSNDFVLRLTGHKP
jgi:hypothetical protein